MGDADTKDDGNSRHVCGQSQTREDVLKSCLCRRTERLLYTRGAELANFERLMLSLLIRLRVSSTFRHGIDVQTDLNHLADVVNAGVILKLIGAE